MTDRELETRLQHSLSALTPDLSPSLLKDCASQPQLSVPPAQSRRRPWAARLSAVAAALVVLAGASLGLRSYRMGHTVGASVSLDVDPSIVLHLNQRERVLDAAGRNDEGVAVLRALDLRGSTPEDAVRALVSAMADAGYLSESANSILVSVEGKDASTAEALRLRLENAAAAASPGGTLAVLSQTVGQEQELEILSQSLSVTPGKAKLLQAVRSAHPLCTLEELAPLSINDLNLLLQGDLPEGLRSTGQASDKAYLGQDAAREIALRHAGLTEDQISHFRWELEYDDGAMVYEVEFASGGMAYEYDIDARTGAILEVDTEPLSGPGSWDDDRDDDDDDDDDRDDDEHDREHDRDDEARDDGWTGGQAVSAAIDPERAVTIALTHAGIARQDARDLSWERDRENGVPVYEVEFICNGVSYEYDIDARTGAILEVDTEPDD